MTKVSSWIEGQSGGARPLIIRRIDEDNLLAQVYLAEVQGLNYSRGRFEWVHIVDGAPP